MQSCPSLVKKEEGLLFYVESIDTNLSLMGRFVMNKHIWMNERAHMTGIWISVKGFSYGGSGTWGVLLLVLLENGYVGDLSLNWTCQHKSYHTT